MIYLTELTPNPLTNKFQDRPQIKGRCKGKKQPSTAPDERTCKSTAPASREVKGNQRTRRVLPPLPARGASEKKKQCKNKIRDRGTVELANHNDNSTI